jgi:cytoskeletal protein CcmA (bactofilin family)
MDLGAPGYARADSTTIGRAAQVVGRVDGEEDLCVEGRVEGSVRLSGALFVAEAAVVKADVSARDVIIEGLVVGNVVAEASVTLAATGRLLGDVRAPRLVMAEGAAFRGQVAVGEASERGGTAHAAKAAESRVHPRAAGVQRRRSEDPGAQDEVTVVVRHAALAEERAPVERPRAAPATTAGAGAAASARALKTSAASARGPLGKVAKLRLPARRKRRATQS